MFSISASAPNFATDTPNYRILCTAYSTFVGGGSVFVHTLRRIKKYSTFADSIYLTNNKYGWALAYYLPTLLRSVLTSHFILLPNMSHRCTVRSILQFAVLLLSIVSIYSTAFAQKNNATRIKLALLKYNGGGDWYANPTSLPNLAKFCNQNMGTNFDPENAVIEPSSEELFNYAFVHMTGHGNFQFSDLEAQNLRTYLISGGFLHIDDNFGLDPYVRPAMKRVFPELEFVELPFTYPIYKQKFSFPNGLPKIHEHDGGRPQGFGLIYEGRLVCFYSFDCDLGDGWEDQSVHKDPEAVRLQALQMGANLVRYVFHQ